MKTKRQEGIRVTLSLFIPVKKNDFAGLSKAIEASNKLQSKEGLTKLGDFPEIEIEEAKAVQTSREQKE